MDLNEMDDRRERPCTAVADRFTFPLKDTDLSSSVVTLLWVKCQVLIQDMLKKGVPVDGLERHLLLYFFLENGVEIQNDHPHRAKLREAVRIAAAMRHCPNRKVAD